MNRQALPLLLTLTATLCACAEPTSPPQSQAPNDMAHARDAAADQLDIARDMTTSDMLTNQQDAGHTHNLRDMDGRADMDMAPDADANMMPADGSAGCGAAHEPGFNCTTLMWGGAERTYCVEVPQGYDPAKPQKLVLGLHGCGGSPSGARGNTSPQVDASVGELLFVYPKALGSCWSYNGAAGVDVDFVRHVITQVSSTHCVEPGHVFADGMSSGGMMASRLLCDGVAQAGALISLNYSCPSPRPVWLYGGTSDEYYAQYILPGRDGWRRANGCTDATRPLPEGPCVEYEGCTARTIWCSDDRGHVWPREPWTAQIVELFKSVAP